MFMSHSNSAVKTYKNEIDDFNRRITANDLDNLYYKVWDVDGSV